MDETLLAAKGIKPSSSTIGHLDGYEIRIGKRATLLPKHGNTAYGVLMTMQAGELERLYADQGVADYIAEPVTVVLADGTSASAICYNLPEHKLEGTNADYALALLTLARKLDLPGDYVDQIEIQAK